MDGTTLIERAARAAAEQYGENWDDLPNINPIQNGELDRAHFIHQVRAVITSIREPSEAMVAAAAECDSSYVVDVYAAMIDAMLEEG